MALCWIPERVETQATRDSLNVNLICIRCTRQQAGLRSLTLGRAICRHPIRMCKLAAAAGKWGARDWAFLGFPPVRPRQYLQLAS